MPTRLNTRSLLPGSGDISFKTISAFLNFSSNNASRILGYVGLGIGILLLLSSMQMFLNINVLLQDKSPHKTGFDFISVTKTISNDNMGKNNSFTDLELADLQKQNFIDDAAPLISNQFRAKASAGSIIPFSTDLFLEAVRNDFIDTVPPSFTWAPGQADVPVIFSSDFLEMYNIFAPTQDLPQLSESSISAVNLILECYGPDGIHQYKAHIVALSDRINSVLVPESFLSWANKKYGNAEKVPAARIYLKAKDANDPALLQYLAEKKYHVNKDKTKFGRIKQVLQAVITSLGGFAILVILLAMMLFSFYLQLMIANSKENLQLLIMLGYSPSWLSKKVSQSWILAYTLIIVSAVALTSLIQYGFQQKFAAGNKVLSPYLDYKIFILAVILWILCLGVNSSLITRLLKRL